MNENTSTRPAIVIDIKRSRIRIHKKTLRGIGGSPEYILLLVNLKERTLAIMGCDRSDPRAHPFLWDTLTDKKSFELYSTTLIQSLCAVCSDWRDNCSHCMYGEIVESKGLVLFHMSDSTPVSSGCGYGK